MASPVANPVVVATAEPGRDPRPPLAREFPGAWQHWPAAMQRYIAYAVTMRMMEIQEGPEGLLRWLALGDVGDVFGTIPRTAVYAKRGCELYHVFVDRAEEFYARRGG